MFFIVAISIDRLGLRCRICIGWLFCTVGSYM